MLKRLLSYFVLAVSLTIGGSVMAQVEWSSPQNGSATENIVEVRWGGNGNGASDWEVGLRTAEGGYQPVSQSDFEWQNGQQVPFTFTFNPSGGAVTFTLGGSTATYNYPSYAGKGLDDLHLIAKTSNNGSNDEWTCQITDLMANGTSVQGVLAAQTVNGNGGQWITGTLGNLTSTLGQIVTVQGNITFSWQGNEPNGSRMEMFCYLGTPYDPSTGNQITVVTPNGGETWTAGTKQRITWGNTNVKKLTISFSSDGGATWDKIKNNIKSSAGYYDWKIPDIQSTNCLIKIENKDNSDVFDISNGPFTVAVPPSIDLTSPDGGELWTAGTAQAITWTSRGLTTVLIEYTTDGTSWTTIEPAAPAAQGAYSWTIPETPTESCKVRISGRGVSDTSSAPFTILPVPAVTLTSPNGGERWTAGSNQNITWTYANIGTLTLQYSTDGATWNTIESNIGATNGSYAWTVPDITSETCRIRLFAADNQAVIDMSDGDFAIVPLPSVSLVSPNGGESWTAGTTQTISWTSVNVGTLTLQYTTDGGTWTTIAENVTAADGAYSWEVPVTPSENCLVRIAGTGLTGISDDSDAAFVINPVPQVTITAPNGGENLIAESLYQITWTQENIGQVNVEYSTDGTTWTAIGSDIDGSLGFLSWVLPGESSGSYAVRITSVTWPGVSDTSDAAFSIIPEPSITITAPNGGETWTAGSSQAITWNSATVSSVTIAYSTDNTTWTTIAENIPAASGTYTWTVPETTTESCVVRISGTVWNVSDVSDGAFSIIPPASITVTTPNGQERWLSGSSQTITWTSASVAAVTIAYSTDGSTWTSVAENVDATAGSYQWTIPATPSEFAFIRVSNAADAGLFDVSDGAFTIAVPKSIAVTSPNGDERWTAGSDVTVAWASASISNVKIEYTADNTTWTTIVESFDAEAGEYTWTLPDIETSSGYVRITDTDDAGITDTSDGPFSITFEPTVALTAPNGGERMIAGTTFDITWTKVNIGEVTLAYTTDGSTWTNIVEYTNADAGSYTWTVPNIPSEFCAVRVTGDSGATDVSDAVFSILPPPAVTVTAPNGGENWTAGTVRNITWTSQTVSLVSLEYSTNGSDWTSIAGNVDASTGSYAWTLPDSESATVTVRISAPAESVSDTSDAPFTITFAPTITLSKPNGGENWTIGSSQNITWSSTNVATVKIEYSTDSGANWTEVAANVDAALGTYAWTIPDVESAACSVRITSEADAGVADTSDAVFSISAQPTVTVTAPNGGESWTAGTSHAITWTSTNVANILVEMSLDGATWTTVAENVPAAAGSYSWTVPASASSTVSIRLTDSANSTVTDTSDNPFTIVPAPAVTVTTPNGGERWAGGTQHAITWTSINIGSVAIEYTTDGSTWTSIAANVSAAAGTYTWTVPYTLSQACIVRITSLDNAAVSDSGDGAFSIVMPPSITVVTPNGGESWMSGSQQTISWTFNDIAQVSIEYTVNGSDWTAIATGIDAQTGSYSWTIPETPSANCQVRVLDSAGSGTRDRSDGVFSIISPSRITVISPNGNESWNGDTIKEIKWSSENVANVTIELSQDGGTTWEPVIANIPAAAGTYSWMVPNIETTAALIRVYAYNNPAVSDQSNSLFLINPAPPDPMLKLISPNGGESITANRQYTIRWESANITSVGIEYTIDGSTWQSVMPITAANSGAFLWTVPNTPSAYCFVRVFDVTNRNTTVTSNNAFTILPAPTITVLGPNGFEQWHANANKTITWSSVNVQSVRILFSSQFGTWTTVAENVPGASGSYAWTVPNTPSIQCQIRIEDMNDAAIGDRSDSYFIILQPVQEKIVNIDTGAIYEELFPAVSEVQAGQTLEFRMSGTYQSENIELVPNNITIRTASGVDVTLHGNWKEQCLRVTGNGITLSGFDVSNAQKNGIKVTGQNVTLRDIASRDYIGKYGVLAENADYLVMTNYSSSNVGEAGLCLSSSDHAMVDGMLTPAFNAVKNGIVVTGCTDALLTHLTIGTDWQDDVEITDSSEIRITESDFRRARHAVYALNSSAISVTNCVTSDMWDDSVMFESCTNSSLTGGTIRSTATAVTMKQCNGMTIKGAYLTSDVQLATGVYALNSSGVTISGCTIDKGWNDAIYLNGSPSASIDHNIMRGMKMGVEVGENSGGASIINNTIVDCHSSGIYIRGSLNNVTIRNNIVVNNGWDYWTWGIQCQNNEHPGLAISYNNVWNNREDYKNCSAGVGDISADPVFVANYTDVHLQPGSPSIDAGDPNDPVGDEPENNGDRIDQGAYGGTGEATPTTARIMSITEAAANGWISMYCYPWDGMEYHNVSSMTDEAIQPWSGFWVIVNRNLDILFPPDQTQGSAPSEMSYIVDPEQYYLISCPLQPVDPDINAVFGDDLGDGGHDGSNWVFWRTSKYNYLSEIYDRYTGTGSIPTIIPGRGFWMYHIYPIPMYLTVTGTPVPQDRFQEFKLPLNEQGGTFHMVGNPFYYPLKWKDVKVRVPMTDSNPLGKVAAVALPEDESQLNLWNISLAVSDPTGTYYDNDNRAGVVESGDNVSSVLSSIDLAPFTGDYVRLVLKDPSGSSDTKYSYDYYGPMKNEYTWDVEISTSFGKIDANFDINGVEEIPKHYTVSLKAPDGTETPIIEDTTLQISLSNFQSAKYTLIARRTDIVETEKAMPKEFGIKGTYPNPFNPSTTIEFSMENDGKVRARVYNLNGQLVTTLVDGFMSAGRHTFVWDASGHASGVYILVMEANGKRDTAKVMLLK